MKSKPLLLTIEGDLARVTLNRPEVHNALSIELSDMLVDAIQTIKKSTAIKFVVIKGAGKSFCVGDDITEMMRWGDDESGQSTQGANGVMRRVRIYQDMANSLEELDKMTISAVDGYAVGGGLEITMACDFVIATEKASFCRHPRGRSEMSLFLRSSIPRVSSSCSVRCPMYLLPSP